MAHDRYWHPGANVAPSDYLSDGSYSAPLPGPPVPPKPATYKHSGVAWRPPERTYEEEADIAGRAYAAQLAEEESRTMERARARTYPYPGFGQPTTTRQRVAYGTTPAGPAEKAQETQASTYAAAAWRRTQGGLREGEGAGRGIRFLVTRTWLNALLLFVPVAWLAHFFGWDQRLTFSFCFVAIVPLQLFLDFLSAQLTLHIGRNIGGFIAITLGNAAQASLAIILLIRCELRLLQATVAGVILLQLLIVPGFALLSSQAGGAPARLNQTLISIGVLALLLLAAFFGATYGTTLPTGPAFALLQTQLLQISRGMAIILIVVYLGSRLILPWIVQEDVTYEPAEGPIPVDEEEEPMLPTGVCLLMIAIFLGLLIVTVLWLVDSFTFIATEPFTAEWFGLILLPFLTFGADVLVGITYLVQSLILPWTHPLAPRPSGLAMDLSIQFVLFWLPLVILIGWILAKPLSFLFDLYEVVLLVGVLYLTNNSSLDSWATPAEGLLLVAAYVMIALCTWFYAGQAAVATLVACPV